ncbi:MAG: FGGY-family carbohydrate kinase [Leptospiraceae bacterium]|nr:FGGY-family carbohydrate kinase [Leptospiraceae bacterium]
MSLEAKYILSIDLGTSGCKTAVCSLSGKVHSFAYREVPLYIKGDGAEQKPSDWWSALIGSASEAVQASGVSSDQILGVCCSTQGEGTVAVDQSGKELMNAVLWMDMRGAPQIARMAGGPVAGYNPWKLYRWIRLTGGAPALSGKDPAAHMLYIKEELPQIYEKTYKFLNVLDYLNLQLTGRFVATHDSILTSWVTDNRNPQKIQYHSGLLAGSGIDTDKFPEIVPCTEVIGNLLPDVAEAMGLSPNTPVVAGGIDNTAAAVGSGAIGDNQAHLYIGTSSWIAAHVKKKKTDVLSSIASVPCALPDRYLMTAMQTTAGGNLTFLKERVLYHQDELLREAHAPDVYKILDIIAARTPAGSRGLLYMPWIFGERSPVDDGNLRAGLINLSLEHSREDIIRAFLEGVALNTRWMMPSVEKFLKQKVGSITMVGGGAISDIWCQIFSDVLGIPILQPEEPMQANVRGSTWIAGVGLREMDFSDIPGLNRLRQEYVPVPEHHEVMNESFKRMLALHRKLAPLYAKWNRGKQIKRTG